MASRKRKVALPQETTQPKEELTPDYRSPVTPKINPNLSSHILDYKTVLKNDSRTVKLEFGVRSNTWDLDIVKTVVSNDEYNMRGYQGPKSTILDIGAHIGGFCTTMKRVFPDSRVIALEAAAFNIPVLAHNLAMSPEIEAYHNAIGEHDGVVVNVISSAGMNTGGNGCVISEETPDSTKTITLSTLAKLCRVDKFDMVKMDCEGAEHLILRHKESADMLKKATYVAAEIHGDLESAIDWFLSNFENVNVKRTSSVLANLYAWNNH